MEFKGHFHRKLIVVCAAACLLFSSWFSLGKNSHRQITKEISYPKFIDSTFFRTDTVSFSRYDKKSVSLEERMALLRTAIKETGADTAGPAFLENPFLDTSNLRTYENSRFVGNDLIQGNGHAEIFIFDVNKDKEDDLIVRYSNGPDDNACFYFLRKKGKFQPFRYTGAYINSIRYENGLLKEVHDISYACCDYYYNTFCVKDFTKETFVMRYCIKTPYVWDSIPSFHLKGTARTKAGAYLRGHPYRHAEEPKVIYNGTERIAPNFLLGVYQEKITGNETWLLVLLYSDDHRPEYTAGWMAKSDTDWK